MWRWWSRFLLLDYCYWVVIIGSACVEICWGWTHWETVGWIGSWGRNLTTRVPHRSRMGYFPWLILCKLLWLNTRVQGEHLTSLLSWAAAWLLVTYVCPVYLVDELVLMFYGFSSMESWRYFGTKLCCILQGSETSAGFLSRNVGGLRVSPVGGMGGVLSTSQKFAHSPPPGKIPTQ